MVSRESGHHIVDSIETLAKTASGGKPCATEAMWIGAENFTTVETLLPAHQNVPGHIISKHYH